LFAIAEKLHKTVNELLNGPYALSPSEYNYWCGYYMLVEEERVAEEKKRKK
jgi:hypothetical protein